MRPKNQRPPEWSLVIGPSVQSRPWAEDSALTSALTPEQLELAYCIWYWYTWYSNESGPAQLRALMPMVTV